MALREVPTGAAEPSVEPRCVQGAGDDLAAVEAVELPISEVVLVAAKQFVRALAVDQHRRLLLACEPHHAPLEINRRGKKRFLLMPVKQRAFVDQPMRIRRDGEGVDLGVARYEV